MTIKDDTSRNQQARATTWTRGDGDAGRTLNILYFGLMILFTTAFLAWGGWALHDRASALRGAAAYDSQCHTAPSPLKGQICTTEEAQIVGRESKQSGNVVTYWLTVQFSDQRTVTVGLGDRSVWEGTTLGESAIAQVWRGAVTSVIITHQIVPTFDNPDVQTSGDVVTLIVCAAFLMIGISLMLLPLLNKRCASADFKRSIVVTSITLGIPALIKALT